MNNLVLIAANGTGVGKDTAALLIQNVLRSYTANKSAFIHHLGDFVKQEVAERFNAPIADMYDRSKKEIYRKAMTEVGNGDRVITDVHKWCRKLEELLAKYYDAVDDVTILIPDIRYPIEPERLKYSLSSKFKIHTLYIYTSPESMHDRIVNAASTKDNYILDKELMYYEWLHVNTTYPNQRQLNPATYNFDTIISNNSTLEVFEAFIKTYVDNVLLK